MQTGLKREPVSDTPTKQARPIYLMEFNHLISDWYGCEHIFCAHCSKKVCNGRELIKLVMGSKQPWEVE